MKVLTAALLALPMAANATLIEWTGTGEQTYYWEDQAHPTATVTILSDENSIKRINVSNTKTSLTYEDPEINFVYSQGLGYWGAIFVEREHQPDFYAGSPDNSVLLSMIMGWRIFEPATANPYNFLDTVSRVQVGSDVREFSFTPTTWTKKVIGPVDVPEPASAALLGLGLLGLAGMRKRAR